MAWRSCRNVTVEEGGALDGLELRLRESGTIVGRVVKADGSPAPRATVWIRDASGRVLNPRSWCVTDGSGRFSFPRREAKAATPCSRARRVPRRTTVAIDVHPGAENEVELRLQEGDDPASWPSEGRAGQGAARAVAGCI
jgi:hypothetical protein